MNECEIRKYAQLMGELGLTGLEIKNQEGIVRLERACAAPAPVPATVPAPQSAPAEEGLLIKSPMVGVFYQASTENAPPYVRVGDRVRQGTVLCLIEAMKMMNEIVSEDSGTIAEILVKNGEVVDFGKPLFRIQRDTP